MSKQYCALITKSQHDYLVYLANELEISLSCCVDCLIEAHGEYKIGNNMRVVFPIKELNRIYNEEYQRKRDDLCYKVKLYTKRDILLPASRYIRAIIRYAMERDSQGKSNKM